MPCRKMLFHFLCHSAEDCKQSSLVLLELLQEWSVQIEFRVPEPVEVKECFFFLCSGILLSSLAIGTVSAKSVCMNVRASCWKYFFIQLRVSTTGPQK